MSNKTKWLVGGLIAVLMVAAVASVIWMNSRYDVVEDVSQVKSMAIDLYESGDIAGAISRMEVYCTYVSTDIDAITTLGDWYFESGYKEKAYDSYYKAASNKKLQDEKIPSLSVKNTEEIILEPLSDVVMEITPDVRMTKDMTLTISNHNLVPEGYFAGKIYNYQEELMGDSWYTTDWFKVDPSGEYLTMSGGFNCAVWQFKDAYGEITHYAESSNAYRKKDTYDVNVYQMARVSIPEKSAWCRVTYYNTALEEETVSTDEELTIVYGRLPGESRPADYSYYEIPDLKEGEKIVYKQGEWSLVTPESETILSDWKLPGIERGSFLSISGVLPGKVSFENSTYCEYLKEGIYTIRFDTKNPSAMGERLDDAKNLGFNSSVASAKIALGENHFDKIYPWSHIKLCCVKNGEVVAYEGEEAFSSDGSKGDLFVEIPKFYVKRVVDESYDTISISGVCHEGFELDSAFLTENGEADKIYIAAYLTSENSEGGMESAADRQPVFSLTPDELSIKTREKGEGYREMDYAALSCVQKLFMVETGLRNSQYLYLGACAYTIATADVANSYYAVALSGNKKTNCINVSDKYAFEEGNYIIIFDSEDWEDSLDAANEDVRAVRTVIDNDDGTLSVYFDGDTIDVTAGKTAIAHTALANGTTRSVGSHTGAMSTARGTVAFKYRSIENLWGNAYVYIDGVTVKDSRVTLTDRAGNKKELSYILPNTNNVTDNIVKKLGYDPQNPQVMLPSFVGDGATISTYYGDSYFSGNESGKEYVLHFGGGWSSKASAGLFSYSAEKTAYETRSDATGRMMYVK